MSLSPPKAPCRARPQPTPPPHRPPPPAPHTLPPPKGGGDEEPFNSRWIGSKVLGRVGTGYNPHSSILATASSKEAQLKLISP